MTPALLEGLNRARAERRAAVLWTWLDTHEQGLHVAGDEADPVLAAPIAARLRSGRSGVETIDGREVFLNVHVPSPRLVVIGAVHISQALARIAALVEFDVTIVDPRTAFATPERFESVHLIPDWPDEVDLALDRYTALAAVTHDPKIDDGPLVAALEAGCFYVGALGSRKTHAKRRERLLTRGVTADAFERIAAPIGLDIGAATPGEIAVAVMAEIVGALRRSGE